MAVKKVDGACGPRRQVEATSSRSARPLYGSEVGGWLRQVPGAASGGTSAATRWLGSSLKHVYAFNAARGAAGKATWNRHIAIVLEAKDATS